MTSAVDEGEWLALQPGRFTRGERDPGTIWIRDLMDPRAGLNAVE
jgi:hypothetical protein